MYALDVDECTDIIQLNWPPVSQIEVVKMPLADEPEKAQAGSSEEYGEAGRVSGGFRSRRRRCLWITSAGAKPQVKPLNTQALA
jgi:hypothetical protein